MTKVAPLVNRNTIPAAAENGVLFITWRPLVNRNTIPALGRKLRIHTPLSFGTPAPYLPFQILRRG